MCTAVGSSSRLEPRSSILDREKFDRSSCNVVHAVGSTIRETVVLQYDATSEDTGLVERSMPGTKSVTSEGPS